MSTQVGGRMETVAPIRLTDSRDRYFLTALVLVSSLLHAWLIHNSAMTARDSLGFAQLAINLAYPDHGKPSDPPPPETPYPRTLPAVLKTAKQPPGYPATIYATYAILRRIDPPKDRTRISQDQLLLAAQIASALAIVFAVFPMYWLGRMLLGQNRAFAAVLVFQFLPVAARDTSDGLSEGLYFLGLSTAMALGVAGIRKQSIGRFLLCGAASGLTYLVRPEGLAVTVGAFGLLLGLALLRWRPPANMLACAAALLVGTGIAAAPYMVLIGGLTNKPSGKQAIEGIPPAGPARPGFGAQAPGGPLFAEINTDTDRGSVLKKAFGAAGTMGREYLHASHYAVGILGLLGAFLIRHRSRSQPEWLLLVAVVAVHLTALARVAYVQGYASERHLLTPAFVATYFALAGLEPLFAWFARWPALAAFYRRPEAQGVWVGILVATCIPSLLKPMHQNRIPFKQAGEYLVKVLRPEDGLTDPYEWAQYYAGRTIYLPPHGGPSAVEYAVLRDSSDAEDKRLNQEVVEHVRCVAGEPWAEQVWPTGPSGGPDKDARVKVYRLDHRAATLGALVGGMSQRW